MGLFRSPHIVLVCLTAGLIGCGDDVSSTDPVVDAVQRGVSDADDAPAKDTSSDTEALVLPDVAGATSDAEDALEPDDEVEPTPDVEVEVEPDVSDPVEPVEPGPESIDCAAIPEGPFELVKLVGPMASEDLAFDREGHLIGSNDNAIFKSLYNGQPQVFVPNINFRAGLRYLPSGQLIVCNNHTGELVRIDPEGTQHVVLTGLSYPNGIIVDLNGWVYFSEHDNGQVRRVNPYTGDYTVLTNEVSSPNGLTFSPDYSTLYIGGFNGSGIVYAMSISPEGVPGKLVEWATDVGTGWLDGMATDACGNVYIADYGATVIYRISPDGKDKKKIISGAGISNAYLPNMQWGSGIGGWDPLSLYLPDGWNKGVFEVQIGVPTAPIPYP
ncbi:MAG: SMP-30/gluconolactonase/LRE family protein [Myxococcota bacterium]